MHLHHWFGGRHHRHDHEDHREHDDFARSCSGRGRFGRFGGGDDDLGGPFGRRHGGGRFGRMFGHGDLRLILLALIAEQPRHGYQLIRTIEEMFGGSYAPSPGAVYPTLTMLEEMGYARVEASEGSRKLYVVTDEGRAYLDENRDTVDALMSRMEVTARAASRYAAPIAIHEAMRTLKRALVMRAPQWSEAEAKRARAIIEKAAAEISAI
ncbi:MAG TPA: PadR family transcriptional regulator [Rhodanobacteraceae bacterium]|nr:PadR family transcriptional regulator [Rhodanobacteraceae bacterium]